MFPPTDAISNALGLASSAAWLGAQFPQLWTNYRLQSAEGLALPFLANWLAGDTANLVGCILTHQLPFQTYLAVYFVWIDFCLLVQYIYYEWYRAPRLEPKLEVDTTGQAPPLTASPTVAYMSTSTSSLPPRSHRTRPGTRSYSRQPLPLPDDLHDEIGAEEHPVMTESICSEPRGASIAGQRGRAFDRVDREADHAEERRKRVSQTSRRGASLVFLAVFGLWGIGLGGPVGVAESGIQRVGRVLPLPTQRVQNTVHPSAYFGTSENVIQPQYVSEPVQPDEDEQKLPPTVPPPAPPPADDEPDRTSWTWVVGRISAWTCTALYLTSRMPQIWKNYTRQSVEGLSISLFVFAFLGNLFYVGSVLSAPRMFGTPAQRVQYIKDCLPYLLGSGGTFAFDFAIIVQSFVYRGLRPIKSTGGQTRRRYSIARATEEDALLGHSRPRSHSASWVHRSPSMSRGRASLDRYRSRPTMDTHSRMQSSTERIGRVGYGATQNSTQGQVGV